MAAVQERQVLVFGATGLAGLAFLEEAITIPHLRLLIYARTPSKLPNSLLVHPQVNVLPGTGSLTDTDGIRSAVSRLQPTDVIISFLGPPATQILAWMNPFGKEGKEPIFANAYRSIVDAMKTTGVRRIFALGTISIVDEKDHRVFSACAMVWIVRLLFYRGWRNMVEVGRFFDTVPVEDIDWTVYRVGLLLNGEAQAVTDGYLGDGKTTSSIRRSELAKWLVMQITTSSESKWIGQKPIVSTARKPRGSELRDYGVDNG
ncbi:hypothetical protein EV426DRAFT_620046 [Tirmania nivea]|nr:hypothetical protein EV426DRAFT_620046 [Tirmania nivea]